jgi:hypothetical protein
MISVETVPGIRGGGMWESSGGVNASRIYLIHFKFCNIPTPSTTAKIKEKKF